MKYELFRGIYLFTNNHSNPRLSNENREESKQWERISTLRKVQGFDGGIGRLKHSFPSRCAYLVPKEFLLYF